MGILLFIRCPVISDEPIYDGKLRLSVIIPARNEAANLANLLMDLENQIKSVYEILCVDDESEDATAQVAADHGVKVITIKEKPEGWTGKSWACQCGARKATGDVYLFLDADVRLSRDAIGRLEGAYQKHGCIISVQPFHHVKKYYEQLSLFFNLILIAANGLGSPFKNKGIGLFGPAILISRAHYNAIDGHVSVKESIVEDLDFGQMLTNKGIGYRLLLGADDIRFSMYTEGMNQLIEGWSKNFATGAGRTSPYLLFMIILWLGALTSSASLFFGAMAGDFAWISVFYAFLYLIGVLQVGIFSSRIGSFRKTAILFYPIALLGFYFIFILSMIKKHFYKKVTWKGREIALRR